MFRPNSEHTVFGYIPVRFIVTMMFLLAMAVVIILFVAVERDWLVMQRLGPGGNSAAGPGAMALPSREFLITSTVMLLLVGGLSVTVLLTSRSYHSTRLALERVKSLARNILHSIPSGVLTVDERGRITAINPSAERFLGLSAEHVLGTSLDQVFREDNPVRDWLRQALDGRRYVRNIDIPYDDRGSRRIRLTTSALNDPDRPAVSGVVLLILDVTDLVQMEEQLRRTEKLSALHTLSAGVAHEIRNPLSALDLNLHLLREELTVETERPAVERYLDILDAEIQRIRGILDSFVRFARPAQLALGEVSLPAVLSHIVELLRGEAQERGVEVTVDVSSTIPTVLGDETLLSQVFLNLMINALQAMPKGGRLALTATPSDGSEIPAVDIGVADTGVGIPNRDLPKLFEPFFSTKSDGTGLGLAIAYRIVEDHQGDIRVSSREGLGTTFTVRLPAAPALQTEGRAT